MKHVIRSYKTVTLELDELEAHWLKALMRNPITKETMPEIETQTDKTMRSIFFNALKDS
jgi:hypothetical protein